MGSESAADGIEVSLDGPPRSARRDDAEVAVTAAGSLLAQVFDADDGQNKNDKNQRPPGRGARDLPEKKTSPAVQVEIPVIFTR